MSEPFLGEMRVFSFNFPPKGWAFCQGQLLSISQNTALFSLLGTYYGGNGVQNFALPNVSGNVLVGIGNAFVIGQQGGEINHTLTVAELPNHIHSVAVSSVTGTASDPTNGFYGSTGNDKPYGTNGTYVSGPVLGATGGGQPHNNMQPILAMNTCIALQGIFPSRN